MHATIPDVHMYTYICIKAGGSPELPGTLSLEPILQTSLWYRDGGWGGGRVISHVERVALRVVETLRMLLR